MSAAATVNLEPETVNSSTLSPPPPVSPSKKLPPSERDFEIYDAIHIDGSSTRYQAKQHEISQTRVRQIIRRVVEWLGEVLPPQTKVAKEQETHLARQIAADRFQRQFEQINELWKATLESKFASIRIRLTTAQARLGAVGGLIDGLAADAIEGLPVPAWQPPAPADHSEICNLQSEIPPDPALNPNSKIENPKSLFPPPGYIPKHRPGPIKEMPQVLWDPLYEHEITPEVVAARAAWGKPISPDWIKRLQDQGKYPRDASSPPPPLSPSPAAPPPTGYCSPSDHDSSDVNPSDAPPIVPTQASSPTCEQSATLPSDHLVQANPAAQPLLTPPTQAPAIEVRISPDQPGATTCVSHPDVTPNLFTAPPAPKLPT